MKIAVRFIPGMLGNGRIMELFVAADLFVPKLPHKAPARESEFAGCANAAAEHSQGDNDLTLRYGFLWIEVFDSNGLEHRLEETPYPVFA